MQTAKCQENRSKNDYSSIKPSANSNPHKYNITRPLIPFLKSLIRSKKAPEVSQNQPCIASFDL